MDKALASFQVPFAMPPMSDEAMDAFDRFTEEMVELMQTAINSGVPDALIMNQFALTIEMYKARTQN